MAGRKQTVTSLLGEAARGNAAAARRLHALIRRELLRLTSSDDEIARPRSAHDLVYSAYLRLVGRRPLDRVCRRQFFVTAAGAMRRLLIDHAQADRGIKGRLLAMIRPEHPVIFSPNPDHLQRLDEALTRLATLDTAKARLVELRFFAGLTTDLAADTLDLPLDTASEDWRFARAWLNRELEATEGLGD